MLSYQHAFHAGNHADLLKHYVLTFVINSLNKKDKPYTFFDTHSGSGLYDLCDNRIIKTGEAQKGIQYLLQNENRVPEVFFDYIELIKEYTCKNMYPGSPEIERRLLRKQDTLILSELHPQEIKNLRKNMTFFNTSMSVIECSEGSPTSMTDTNGVKNTMMTDTDRSNTSMSVIDSSFVQPQIHNRDGWEMLKALTPPKTKRGAVLIDPSYEETQDYINATNTILEVNKKWSNGIIMLWYPLLAHREGEIQKMLTTIQNGVQKNNVNTEICNLQLCVYDKEDSNLPRLYGSGMFVINAPWKLEEEAQIVINYLKNEIGSQFQKEN